MWYYHADSDTICITTYVDDTCYLYYREWCAIVEHPSNEITIPAYTTADWKLSYETFIQIMRFTDCV